MTRTATAADPLHRFEERETNEHDNQPLDLHPTAIGAGEVATRDEQYTYQEEAADPHRLAAELLEYTKSRNLGTKRMATGTATSLDVRSSRRRTWEL